MKQKEPGYNKKKIITLKHKTNKIKFKRRRRRNNTALCDVLVKFILGEHNVDELIA